MKNNIFIPKLCKVGFNERNDTYTGMLGYVIYNDGKKWRKEPSWNGWREKYLSPEEAEEQRIKQYHKQVENIIYYAERNNGEHRFYNHSKGEWVTLKNIKTKEDVMEHFSLETYEYTPHGYSSNEKIKPFEFNNEPMEGFVLNKKAGGGRYGWNPRQTYCRVYDPRGFEFEITIPNLLYILENTSSIKGKGLEGKFIYGWDGKDHVLIPENSPEFESMIKYTELQDGKVYKKDMVRGNYYLDSKGEKLTYMGDAREIDWSGKPSTKKKVWFMTDSEKSYNKFRCYSSVQPIKADLKETNPNFANMMDELEKHDSYYPFEEEYVKIEKSEIIERLEKLLEYHSRRNIFVKRGDKDFKKFSISKGYSRRSYFGNRNDERVYNIYIDGQWIDDLKTLNEIKDKYDQLWELKTTK